MAHMGVSLVLLFCAGYVLFSAVRALYYLYFHPLAHIPGPKLRAAFFFPQVWDLFTGEVVNNGHALHERYGDIVRISPTWVSFIKPEAWRDIYGYGSKTPIPKDPAIYTNGEDGVPNILSSNDADHSRIRRLLNHGFSEQALRSQESIISSYITLLIEKLHAKAQSGTPVDITRYTNFATFDIIGDLCFAESFGALEAEEYHEWMANLFKGVKLARLVRIFQTYPILGVPFFLLAKLFPKLMEAKTKHLMYTNIKTEKRIDTKTDRKDFMSYVLRHNDEKGMTREEIVRTMRVLITAGSETSATLLSGAIYYLLKNPTWLEQLKLELDTAFKDESEMTLASLGKLKVLNAVLSETSRMYPPVPVMLPRKTIERDAVVCGTVIPKGCVVGVLQYAASRSSRYFKHPDVFSPERYLGDMEFKDDNKSASQPFSVGPRNCIGQTMAWLEMRAVLAKLVWHFEIELLDKASNWDKQKVFIFWDKPELLVRLKARH